MNFRSLARLSDSELFAATKTLRGEERAIVAETILHLSEIDRRGIYRDAGYASLFSYACEGLGYSEGSAHRRVQAARCLKHSPEAYELLKAGKLTLCALAEAAKVMTNENRAQVLSHVQGKSKRDAERVAIQFGAPAQPRRASIRPRLVIARRTEQRISAEEFDLFSTPIYSTLTSPVEQTSAQPLATGRAMEQTIGQQIGQELERADRKMTFAVSFELSEEGKALYDEVRAAIGPCSIAEVFERALHEFVQKRRPKKQRMKRRATELVAVKAPGATEKRRRVVSAEVEQTEAEQTVQTKRNRRIPSSVKRAVAKRDRGQCSYVSSDGRRCGEKTRLEFDHITPYALGGSHEADNLRLRCRAHNQLHAEQHFGKELIERCRARRC